MRKRMKIFVASSFLNKWAANSLMRFLRRNGYEITSTWVKNPTSEDAEVLRQEALADMNELVAADVFILLLPCRYGSSVEFGAALAEGKPVIVYAAVPTNLAAQNVYYFHPAVLVVSDRKALLKEMTRMRKYKFGGKR